MGNHCGAISPIPWQMSIAACASAGDGVDVHRVEQILSAGNGVLRRGYPGAFRATARDSAEQAISNLHQAAGAE